VHPLLSDIAIGCMCISLFCLGNASLSAHIHNSCIYQLIYILRSSQKSIFEVDLSSFNLCNNGSGGGGLVGVHKTALQVLFMAPVRGVNFKL